MSMKKALEVMKAARTGFLATSDGHKPSVRPMSGLRWVGEELWLACSLKSRKVRDLKRRPYAEVCFMDKSCNHVRIAGPARVSASRRDRQVLLKLMPFLKNYVRGPDDPDYAIIRLRPESVRLMAFAEMRYRELLAKGRPRRRATR